MTSPLSSPDLDARSLALRRIVVDAMIAAGRGHLGAAMSLIEIVRVLYDDVLRIRPDEPSWSDRDRFILSKGHGCLALYAILADKGFFPAATLATFCQHDSILGGHPEYSYVLVAPDTFAPDTTLPGIGGTIRSEAFRQVRWANLPLCESEQDVYNGVMLLQKRRSWSSR